jgi:hypothetical protein
LFNGCHDGKGSTHLSCGAGREAITVLLYFVSIASMFALFASVIAGTCWLLARCVRALIAPSTDHKRRSDASAGFNPHHLKRAGQ